MRDRPRPGHLPDDLALEEPAEPAWVVGTIGVSYDEGDDRVVLVIEELVPEDETGAIARLSITREQAAGVCHPGHPAGRVGPAALPAVRLAARPVRTRMPANQRTPSPGRVTGWRPDARSRAGVGRPRCSATCDVSVVGRLPWSSNLTFLVTIEAGAAEPLHAVYKPARGERSLWDFPDGLYRREVAAYELSEALGWGLVPPTVDRDDGPFGPRLAAAVRGGRLRAALLHPVRRGRHDEDALRAMCAFDVVANNADRKSGHVLEGPDGRLWAHRPRACASTGSPSCAP